MGKAEKHIAGALGALIVSLLLVGVVSGTPVRHLIQAGPATLALVLVARRVSWAAFAALPIFLFWLLLMVAIWLWLLGLAKIVTGQFTAVEIALTLAIVASAVWGVAGVFRAPPASTVARAASFVLFAALQVGALWASLPRPSPAAKVNLVRAQAGDPLTFPPMRTAQPHFSGTRSPWLSCVVAVSPLGKPELDLSPVHAFRIPALPLVIIEVPVVLWRGSRPGLSALLPSQ